MKLISLKIGQSAKIDKIDESDFYLKLLEMGCVPGEKIHVSQIAPFGDPISITINNCYFLSLRLEEAQTIHVTPI